MKTRIVGISVLLSAVAVMTAFGGQQYNFGLPPVFDAVISPNPCK